MALPPRLGRTQLLMVAVVAMAVTGLAGCQSGQGSGSAGHGVQADGYTAAFAAGRYDEAYRLAEPASSSGNVGERERAALIAGMSASAMGKRDVAARWLTPLVSSTDRHIAGRAYWTLGTIADSQSRQADAAKYYAEAGERLDGDDGAKAFTAAGDAYSKLRLEDQARAQYALAQNKTNGGSRAGDVESSTAPRMAGGADGQSGAICTVVTVLPASSGSSPARAAVTNSATLTGRYVIQLCALAKKDSAESQAKKAKSVAAKAGTPSPKVVPAVDQAGRTLYAVRIGPYSSRDMASADLRRLGISGVVMAERN